jgi:phenylacetate-CoA ligase
VVAPATGGPLPDGRRGELVFTSLTKEALPVIRYRTRDLAELLPGTARPMRRIGRITGRSDDMLIIRGVNVFPNQIEELVLREPALSPHYVLEVRREGRLDQLDVIVEPRDASVAQETAGEAILRVGRRIKDLVGVTASVRLTPPGTVARSMGKAKRVIDLRR